MIRYLTVLLLGILGVLNGYGQSNAVIHGRVVDTIGETPIASATVSIYQKDNGKILKYGFTNNRGQFNLTDVALMDTVFKVRISYVGYQTAEMNVSRELSRTDIHIGDIRMKSVSNQIEEVQVNRPPIMMNRDTLVIHPEAFDLQPNAVVEDLLTKVPGIVIWGDGAITVNGKKVDKVLVEGQSFFGSSSNAAIATRNLPAGAIDKVKVYDSPSNPSDPENSQGREETMDIDIILKNGKKRGVFGKVGLSEGTKGHKEKTLLVNVFDPKNQISFFAGSNNTNKVARNAGDFLAANVYKAGGEDLETNTPRLHQRGMNDFFIAGTKFERKWSDALRTNLELLHDDRKSEVLQGVYEIRMLGEGNKQEIIESQEDNRRNIRQSYIGTSRYMDKKWDFRISSNIQQSRITEDQFRSRQVIDQSGQDLSDLYNDMHTEEQNRTGKVGFNLRQVGLHGQTRFNLSYQFEAENRKQNQQEHILFTDEDPIDRLKQHNFKESRHVVDAGISLNGLLSVMGMQPMGVSVDLNNSLKTRQLDEDQQDYFFDPATDGYTFRNGAITYSDRLREITWTPEIKFSKSFTKQLGRGHNAWAFDAGLGLETFSRKNASDHMLRTLDQHMLYLLPSVGAQYRRIRQLSTTTIRLGYNSLVHQPQVDQLIALIDTTQRDFNQIGNRRLKPEEEYLFSLEYSNIHHSKNMSQRLKLSYSLHGNQHVNSNTYLEDGARWSQTVNTAGLPSFRGDYQYRIGKKAWGKALNISLLSMMNGGQRYFFNNDVRHKTTRIMMTHRPQVHYTLSDQLKFGILGEYQTSWSSSGLNNTRASSMGVGMDAVLTWPRRTTWVSRFMSLTNRYSSGTIPGDQRYLWNADVYYRMLKKEQLEIKLSAYDILNNSRSIQNILRDNTVRQIRINNIQQFFMIGLSYYPRFF